MKIHERDVHGVVGENEGAVSFLKLVMFSFVFKQWFFVGSGM